MFLHLGWGYMFVVQWYLRRRKMAKCIACLKGAMREWCSVMLLCGGKLSLNPVVKFNSTVTPLLLKHQNSKLCTVSPKIGVDLTGWSRFEDKGVQTSVYDIFTLIQTSGIVLQVPPQCQKLKCLAWRKESDGTGIIFGSDVESFIDMCCQYLLSPPGDISVHCVISIDIIRPPDNCDFMHQNTETQLLSNTDYLHLKGESQNQSDTNSLRLKAESLKMGKGLVKPKGNTHSKPPNILVYCGKVNSKRHFQTVFNTLQSCVNKDFYAIYELLHNHVKTFPWQENTVLVIITCDFLTDGLEEIFREYLQQGGNVMSFGSSLESHFVSVKQVCSGTLLASFTILSKYENVSFIQGRFNYEEPKSRQAGPQVAVLGREATGQGAVVLGLSASEDTNTSMGRAVFSQVYLHRDPTEAAMNTKMFDQLKRSNQARIEILRHLLSWLGVDCDQSGTSDRCLSPASLLVPNLKTKELLLGSIRSRWKSGVVQSPGLELRFVEEEEEGELEVSSKHLPVRCSERPQRHKYFQENLYWQNLQAETLGTAIIYTDVIPTTMALFEGLMFLVPDNIGLVAVAGRQTSGKGRGGNVWLSPEGCAMFSALVRVPVDSPLGRRVSFLQHLTALAVLHSINTLPGYQMVNIKLKWPNDIYYSDKMKLGGVIVNSTILGSTIYAVIGCGFNVTNSNPTICVNDVIRQHNSEHNTRLAECSPEQLIARTLSHLETLIADFQTRGHQHFSQQYYRSWLHSGQHVQLEGEGEVCITGLDDFGYLQVQTLNTGRVISLQPDGNTFDMMHNLIRFKSPN